MKISEETKTIVMIAVILLLVLVVYFRAVAAPQEQEKSKPTINPPVAEAHYTHAIVFPESGFAPIAAVESESIPEQIAGLSETENTGSKTEPVEPIAPLDEAVGFYRPDVPMPEEYQVALYEICTETGVDINLALGLIEHESAFNPYAISETGCYGYCQLSCYFPSGLSPEDNLRTGIGWFGELIAQHQNVSKALTVYHIGHDDGTRTYANIVLGYAREWGYSE